jgi:agmatinase
MNLEELMKRDLPYSGIATFCKFPHTRDLRDIDVAVLGIPLDTGTTNRPGARFGPRSIRMASMHYGACFQPQRGGIFDIEIDRTILAGLTFADFGDVPILPTMTEKNMELIRDAAKKTIEHGAFLISLGGDHSVSFPLVEAFGDLPLDIVHFDTHLDFMDDIQGMGMKYTHGSPIKRISELPNIGRITQIGIRGLLNQTYLKAEAEKRGSTIITADKAFEKGTAWTLGQIPEAKNIYVSIDIDALDPSVAPGTGTPEPGGFSYRELKAMLTGLPEKGNIVGFDIVEVNPLYDNGDITSLVAARLAIDFLGAIMEKRK